MIILILCAICIIGGLTMLIAPQTGMKKDAMQTSSDLEAQKKKIRISGGCTLAVGIILLLQHIL